MVVYKKKNRRKKIPPLSKEEIKNIGNSINKGLTDLDKKLKRKK